MEFYMHSHDINSYMTDDVVQKTMHPTNLRKRLNGDIGILHKHVL